MADFANFEEFWDIDDEKLKIYNVVTTYRNRVYDTVLGGGSWQFWTTSFEDSTGTEYNAQTGGNTGDWKAASYAFDVSVIVV